MIVAGVTSEAVFVNRYETEGRVSLEATKTLSGRALTPNLFRFYVYDRDPADAESVVLAAASNAADGTVRFGSFRYGNAEDGETFTYYIKEIDRGRPGYTVDARVVRAEVTAHDLGDGSMRCDVVYFDENGEELTGGAIFENEYHAAGTLTLRAWKELKGRTLLADEFSFELFDSEGNCLETATNGADGGVSFSALHFTEADAGETYYYFVREAKGDDPTVVYTDESFGYAVTVHDNGDGTLSFTQSYVDATDRWLDCASCGGTGFVACET